MFITVSKHRHIKWEKINMLTAGIQESPPRHLCCTIQVYLSMKVFFWGRLSIGLLTIRLLLSGDKKKKTLKMLHVLLIIIKVHWHTHYLWCFLIAIFPIKTINLMPRTMLVIIYIILLVSPQNPPEKYIGHFEGSVCSWFSRWNFSTHLDTPYLGFLYVPDHSHSARCRTLSSGVLEIDNN